MRRLNVTLVSFKVCLLLLMFLAASEAARIEKVDVNYLPTRRAIAPDGFIYTVSLFPGAPRHITIRQNEAQPSLKEIQNARNDFPGITFVNGLVEAPGEFSIIHYDAIKNEEENPLGERFHVVFISSQANFPIQNLGGPYTLQWIQFIDTDWPTGAAVGMPTPYIDPQPNDDPPGQGLPFYHTDEERQRLDVIGQVTPGFLYLRFNDKPCRGFERPAVNWKAHLYLVAWNSGTTTTPATRPVVVFYDGIEWGFKIRRVGKTDPGPDVCGGVGSRDKVPFETCAYASDGTIYGFDPVDVIDMTVAPAQLVPGQTATVSLTVENQGDFDEDVNLEVYADLDATVLGDEITIGTQLLENLPVDGTRQLTFSWDTTGLPYGDYVVSANATTVYPWADNSLIDNEFHVTLKLTGDVNLDGRVNIVDLTLIATRYGRVLPPVPFEGWEPRADINCDGVVSILDISAAATNFGSTAQ